MQYTMIKVNLLIDTVDKHGTCGYSGDQLGKIIQDIQYSSDLNYAPH